MPIVRSLVASLTCLGLLAACGQEPPPAPPVSPQKTAPTAAELRVSIQPAQPTSSDCLHVVLRGQPGQPAYRWEVNGQPVTAERPGGLCNVFKRGDRVSVHVGTAGASGAATVTIGNSPPKVTAISATPKQLYAGQDIEVSPVAEDKDGDPVEFRYQWLIDGEADPLLTEARLPGDRVVRGTKVQVKITPYDGQGEGPAYQSYAMPVPDAPPQILSQPPQRFEALEYQYQFKAKDPDGDKITYTLEKAPAGMTIDRATGLVSWPLAGVKPGAYPVKIVATDPEGGAAFQEYTLTLGAPTPPPGGRKP